MKDEQITLALQWLKDHQTPKGLWENSYSSIHSSNLSIDVQYWITLNICRIFKRFYNAKLLIQNAKL